MFRLLLLILPLLVAAPPPPAGPPPSGPSPPSSPSNGPGGPGGLGGPGGPPSGPPTGGPSPPGQPSGGPSPPGTPPGKPTPPGPLPAFQTSVSFGGQTYINKGLVAFGAVSGDATDSRGDTIGGIGSAIAIESFRKSPGGYSGVMLAQPDRGHNTQGTVDYEARRHRIGFQLNPYYGADNKTYAEAKATLQQTYQSSIFYHEQDGTPTTGLNPLDIRAGNPPLPIPSASYNRISTDAEGLVLNNDGSSWVSDEYGPYIYKYSADGTLLLTISPPMAVLPYYQGKLNFNANDGFTPDTGRVPNQGFEGLAASPDGSKLFALLQSATVQDSPSGDKGRYTRFYEWDVSGAPHLVHAYVLQLPVTNGKGKALAQSELHYISDDTFLVLSRDGKGNGDTDDDAKNKDFVLYSTSGATDILNTDYTTGTKPVAPNNKLDSSITAMVGTDFIDMLDEVQLARFGLCNDCGFSVNLINSKWESIALASIQDPAYPNDYFLFSFSDNDFISLHGSQSGQAYSDPYAQQVGYSLDNQVLVWRIALP